MPLSDGISALPSTAAGTEHWAAESSVLQTARGAGVHPPQQHLPQRHKAGEHSLRPRKAGFQNHRLRSQQKHATARQILRNAHKNRHFVLQSARDVWWRELHRESGLLGGGSDFVRNDSRLHSLRLWVPRLNYWKHTSQGTRFGVRIIQTLRTLFERPDFKAIEKEPKIKVELQISQKSSLV